jgi:hypothetical protein
MEAKWLDCIQVIASVAMAVAAFAQALAACLLVYLTWRSLLVLRGYAEDTKRIADKSVEQIGISIQQTENAQKPFLALVTKPPANLFRGGWVIENQGSGPALNIYHSHHGGEVGTVNIPPLAKGEFRILISFDYDAVVTKPFEMTYDSLSGIGYVTVVSWVAGEMRTVFAPQ